jgi:hypothetical protein
MNIQKRIDSLQPYVVGIRFVEGMSVIDAVFKEGWTVPKSSVVQSEKNPEADVNYHMFFTQKEDIGVDEIFDFIESIINLNIEREKKYELLKVKVKELQELFKNNPLNRLEGMKFVLGGEQLIPDVMPEDPLDTVGVDIDESSMIVEPEKEEPKAPEPVVEAKKEPNNSRTVELKEQEIELPPKGKIELEEFEAPTNIVCKCGPDEVCPACEEEKLGAY